MKTDKITLNADDITTSSITITADYIKLTTAPVSIAPLRPPSSNCVNCGAPLPSDRVCHYCKTRNN